MNENIIIRPAEDRDIPKILEIYTPYIEKTCISFEYTTPSLEDFTKRFYGITENFPWLVCEINGETVGYAYASKAFERAAYQWDADISVYIKDEYQGLGIGRRFYICIESLLKIMGYINLYAIISGVNESSIIFHEKLGYERFAVFDKTGFKFGGWLDTIWYRKLLNEFSENPVSPVNFRSLDSETVQKILTYNVKNGG